MAEDTNDPTSKAASWWKWAVGGVVLLVALAIGVPYAYIHLGSSDTPPPLSLATSGSGATAGSSSSGTAGTGTAGGASTSVAGTWKVTDGSTAGYRIKETLMGQSTEAVGRTSAVSGTVTIAGDQVTAAELRVDLTKVTSDKRQRDGQFQGRIMETSTYPTATFVLTQPIPLGAVPADGATTTVPATGDLTIHGVTKPVTLELTAQRSGSTIEVSGATTIVFSDYKINNPSGGPASVGDDGQLEFLVILAPA